MANLVITCVNSEVPVGTVGITSYHPETMVHASQVWLEANDLSGLAAFEKSGEVYDPAFHEYYYEWTVRGEPFAAWSKPTNLLAAHNNPNKAFGKKVAILLSAPGNYYVDLVVTDRLGNTATASTEQLTVVAPEVHFPEADRIYVDPDGTYAGVPVASDRCQTLEEMRLKLADHTTNDTWVLLRKGVEHPLTGADPSNNDNFKGTIYFDQFNEVKLITGYGSGANPVVTPDPDPRRTATNSMFQIIHPKTGDWRTVSGVDFRGNRDAGTEHGFGPYAAGAGISGWRREDGFSLIHDSTVNGFSGGFLPGGANLSHAPEGRHYQMIADCACDGWRAMGVHGTGDKSHLALVGMRLVQDVNGPNRGDRTDGIRNNHGAIRIGRAKYIYASGLDLFNRGGWDGADQPCFRIMTNPDASQEGGVVERCSMEGGFQTIQMNSSDGGVLYPVNFVFERLLLVTGAYTSVSLLTARSGVTVRTNVIIRPDIPPLVVPGYGEIIFSITSSGSYSEGLLDDPVAVYGNTVINLMSDANDSNREYPMVGFTAAPNNWTEDVYTDTLVENNVHHRPVGGTVVDTYAPIDLTTTFSGFTSRNLGRSFSFEYPTVTLTEDKLVGDVVSIPYSDIGDGLYFGASSTGPTDQAYWLAVTDTEHQIVIDDVTHGRRHYHEPEGHISITFGATTVDVENTSGETWTSGSEFKLWLDRSSLRPAPESTYANPETIPLPRPQTGSAAIGAATTGRVSPKDFFLTDRGATPSKGALEPA